MGETPRGNPLIVSSSCEFYSVSLAAFEKAPETCSFNTYPYRPLLLSQGLDRTSLVFYENYEMHNKLSCSGFRFDYNYFQICRIDTKNMSYSQGGRLKSQMIKGSTTQEVPLMHYELSFLAAMKR